MFKIFRLRTLFIFLGLFFGSCGKIEVSPVPVETIHGVIDLKGTPKEIGRQYGEKSGESIRIMINEYVGHVIENGKLNTTVQKRITRMKPSLPDWYLKELKACAESAEIDEDVLLYAQCEGDINSLQGCTTYVAFADASYNGTMLIGRNFDYSGIESTKECSVILSVIPRKEDGYAFVSVGWTGILGGWTFVNEKGIFVANNIGGFTKKDPKGIPTLIMERIIAQKASTLDEAIALINKYPRMRGQALIIGQFPDKKRNTRPDAAVVLYDAETVEVHKAENGFAFHSSCGSSETKTRKAIKGAMTNVWDAIVTAGNRSTMHSVVIHPETWSLFVAQGSETFAHLGGYKEYNIRELLKKIDD